MPHLSYQVTNWDEMPYLTAIILLNLRLEFLYSKFLLHKLLTEHGGSDRAPMIHTAHEILGLVLLHVKKRTMLVAHRMDMEWTVSTCGLAHTYEQIVVLISTDGILCNAMRKYTTLGAPQTRATASEIWDAQSSHCRERHQHSRILL
jgi:hypothetical protein